MSLSHDEVRKVARLARLQLTDDEVQLFSTQLGKVLDFVGVLDELSLDDVEPLVYAIDVENVLRNDEPRPSLPREAALQNAPSTDGRAFRVPPIIEAD